jgi:hypothetical protein
MAAFREETLFLTQKLKISVVHKFTNLLTVEDKILFRIAKRI